LPVVWVVLNNGGHGMVRRGDTLMKGKDLGVSKFSAALDAAGIARGLGAAGIRVETAAEFRWAIEHALRSAGPTVIYAVIDRDEVAPTLERRVQTLARFFAARGAVGG